MHRCWGPPLSGVALSTPKFHAIHADPPLIVVSTVVFVLIFRSCDFIDLVATPPAGHRWPSLPMGK